ncbi:MAG: cupin domain-containing protein [Hyphomicrobiales bacterium]
MQKAESDLATAVLICPRTGGRLWPLSRQDFPDLFVPIDHGASLFDRGVELAHAIGGSSRVLTTIEEPHRFLASEAIEKAGLEGTVILDNGTGGLLEAAIMAALTASKANSDVMLVLVPMGKGLLNATGLAKAISEGVKRASEGAISAIGSTGIIVARAATLLGLAERSAPETLKACKEAFRQQTVDPPFIRPGSLHDHRPVRSLEEIFLSPAAKPEVVPFGAVAAAPLALGSVLAPGDSAGNVEQIDCRSTSVLSEHRLAIAVGLDDVVIVDTPDALLVAKRDKLDPDQIARRIEGRPEHAAHRRVLRPWGAFEGIDRGPRHQVKHITVKPGAALSLQYHHHRAEHWIVVRGTARVTCGERTFILHENESTFIPLGTVHRLENPGKIPLEIIEVQSGSYLGEDDIVRIEDVYGRTDEAKPKAG